MTNHVPPAGGSARETARALNQVINGKINSVNAITLAANTTTTTVNDPLVSKSSAFVFSPQTAHAAAIATPYALLANITEGVSYVITHANDANTDKIFTVAVLG